MFTSSNPYSRILFFHARGDCIPLQSPLIICWYCLTFCRLRLYCSCNESTCVCSESYRSLVSAYFFRKSAAFFFKESSLFRFTLSGKLLSQVNFGTFSVSLASISFCELKFFFSTLSNPERSACL